MENHRDIAEQIASLEIKIHDLVRNEIGNKVLRREQVAQIYYDYLKIHLIADYSIDKATPRIKREYVKYFTLIDNMCHLLHESSLTTKHFNQLVRMLLSHFDENAIKMICYYGYLFYDIVNSNDASFTCTNIITQSKVFAGKLPLSDDFSRNLDPRSNIFDNSIAQYKAEVATKRR